jgi:acyl-CoA thioesterase I
MPMSWDIKRSVVRLLVAAGLMVFTVAMPAATASAKLKIVAFGDSLVAGYGLPAAEAFPARLQAALTAKGYEVQVLDAGVSGDTTAGGLARFDWAVPEDADAVMLELGANDALRGISPEVTRKNLAAILDKLASRNLPVLIIGMRSPANWGQPYADAFDPIFSDLAKQYGHDLYPFFLEGVALRKELNQADGMHPNAEGVRQIVNRLLPYVERLIARARKPD